MPIPGRNLKIKVTIHYAWFPPPTVTWKKIKQSTAPICERHISGMGLALFILWPFNFEITCYSLINSNELKFFSQSHNASLSQTHHPWSKIECFNHLQVAHIFWIHLNPKCQRNQLKLWYWKQTWPNLLNYLSQILKGKLNFFIGLFWAVVTCIVLKDNKVKVQNLVWYTTL